MLAPYRWMRDYAAISSGPEEIAKKMVMMGTETEEIEKIGEDIVNVLVGRVDSIEKHPDADRLFVCQVDVGEDELLQIVTGADNVSEGDYVPVARATATLPSGTIKKGKLRGVQSYGMLCSGEELKLTEGDYPGAGVDGIFLLPDMPKPGTDIRELLDLDGTVIEFEVTADRPDCLSMLGIAREAAAADEVPFTEPDISYTETDKKIEDMVSVTVEDTELCTRYMAAAITDVVVERSPQWMRTRLREAGIRPISNIVDITNFVMLETGQPLHAFDAADIRGDEIIVRRAQAGEKMVTLDDVERTFTENMLLICDAKGPIGVAGVMGGEDSEIKDTTQTVVFESAKFNYGNIRQTSRALGLSTESSLRFSKGVDAVGTEFALERVLTLVEELGAGKVVRGKIDILHEDPSPRIIKTTAGQVNALLGTDISVKDMQQYLNRAFIQTGSIGDELVCTIPSFRGDISGSADIAEEVARMFGYDNIPATQMDAKVRRGKLTQEESKTDAVKHYLVDSGYLECSTYSFAGKQDYEKLGIPMPKSVQLLNPQGDDSAYMRQTLAAHMLKVASLNLNRKNNQFNLFEIARLYTPVEGELLPVETPWLCMIQTGEGTDFFTLKGAVENIVELVCGKKITNIRTDLPYLHPGISADILIDDKKVGVMGEIAPDTAEAFELPQKVVMAEIDLDKLFAFKKPEICYQALPKFPAATRDIAVIIDAKIGAGDLQRAIYTAGGKRVERVELFDVYEGEQMEAGKKSVAFALAIRAQESTMTDEEVDAIMKRIIATLEETYQAELRKS